jgi:hypothetical protein
MRHTISYGHWSILSIPVENKGFDFLIGIDMSKPSENEPYVMVLFVGCFQEPAKGVRVCKRLIDLCIEKHRRSTVEIVKVCAENFWIDSTTAADDQYQDDHA